MKTGTVQNFYFVAVAGLSIAMLACPMCTAPAHDCDIRFADSFAFVVLSLVPFILSVVAICNTKRPQIKLRLAVMSAIVLLAYQIWIAVMFFRLRQSFVFCIPAVFPLVALVLDILGLKNVINELSYSAALEIRNTMEQANRMKKHNKDRL